MIRGCQKRIYYVKDPHSSLFAEAYFVLKDSGRSYTSCSSPSAARMAAEAERIVSEFSSQGSSAGYLSSSKDRYSSGQKFGAFLIGAASSSAIIGGVALLLALS